MTSRDLDRRTVRALAVPVVMALLCTGGAFAQGVGEVFDWESVNVLCGLGGSGSGASPEYSNGAYAIPSDLVDQGCSLHIVWKLPTSQQTSAGHDLLKYAYGPPSAPNHGGLIQEPMQFLGPGLQITSPSQWHAKTVVSLSALSLPARLGMCIRPYPSPDHTYKCSAPQYRNFILGPPAAGPPQITSFDLIGTNPVLLDVDYAGLATHYLISEDSGFAGASWQTWLPNTGGSNPTYMFQPGPGASVRTLYLKLRNGANGPESSVSTVTKNLSGLKQVFVLIGGEVVEAYEFAGQRGFGFVGAEADPDVRSQCSFDTSSGRLELVAGAAPGKPLLNTGFIAECRFVLFADRPLRRGWELQEVRFARIRPRRASWSWLDAPDAQRPAFSVSMSLPEPTPFDLESSATLRIDRLEIEGPYSAADWKEGFEP